MFERLRVKFMRYRRLHWPRRIRKLRLMSHHPSFKVPLITFGLLIVLTAGGYFLAKGTDKLPPAHDAKIVIISHDDTQQIVPSKQDTVGQLIKKLDIKVNPGDVVEPSPNTHINQDQFRINIYRAVPVEIVDGDKHTFTFSASKTPRAIAQQVGTQLYPEDAVTTRPVQDFVKNSAVGEQVIVNRSAPISVDLYGTPVTLRTQAKTVAGLIREKGIKLIKDDKVVPGPETPIAGLQNLSFIRTGLKTETRTEAIAMPVQKINDPNLAYGTNAIRQQGSPGEQIVTYEVNIVNNVETARKIIQTVVTKAAVTQVMVVGTSLAGIKGDMARAGIAPSDYNYADYIISHESGWNPQAQNASGAYGLCQALPGSKMSSAGSDWASNPVTQLRWCDGYAKGRFGGWAGAYNYWVSHHYW
jgi:resuscitation-promoting factor RpfB